MIKYYRVLLVLLILTLIYSCDKEKSPIIYKPIYDMQYVDSWPKTMFVRGVGYPEPSLPLLQQRAGVIEEARLFSLSLMYFQIEALRINGSQFISNVIKENPVIKDKIREYIESNYIILDTWFMADGSVEIDISLLTDGIFEILDE
jgi:hypothetical protein